MKLSMYFVAWTQFCNAVWFFLRIFFFLTLCAVIDTSYSSWILIQSDWIIGLVSEKLIFDLITKSPDKSSGLDLMPTPLLKQCLLELVPVMTKILNFALHMGILAEAFKHAAVTPLLKEAGLDVNEFKKKKKKPQTSLEPIISV